MPRRYFSENSLVAGQTALLTDAEAHHLRHVLRAQPGAVVTLFDGSGREFLATVLAVKRSQIELEIGTASEPARELPFKVHVGAPAPKADRQRWLVEKAVELGVTRLTPLVTAHSDANPQHSVAKWGRYVIEASKQCGRNRLMEIGPVVTWSQWLAQTSEATPLHGKYVAHPGGRHVRELLDSPPGDLVLAVGPEGGLSDAEVGQALEQGWTALDLGPRILRMETAVAALAALASARS